MAGGVHESPNDTLGVLEMLDIALKTTDPATVAYVSMRGPYTQIPEAMGRLYGWVAQHGLQPVGMPTGVYIDDPQAVDVDTARWEVQTAIAGDPPAVDEPGEVGIKRVEPHLVASVMHRGDYDHIAPTYNQLGEWVAGHGYEIVGPAEELYYSDPATTAPEDYLTEIRFPVAPH
jgi:AraC family transcriptional regulator